MKKEIVIFTGTPENNLAVDELLHKCGFKWSCGREMIPTNMIWSRALARTIADGKVKCVSIDTPNDAYGYKCEVYTSVGLTQEIVASLPGARELPPSGPFEFEGRQWVVDGDEKRRVRYMDYFIGECDGKINRMVNYCKSEFYEQYIGERWILRPLITEELQAAIDHQQQTAKTVSSARKANKEALALVAELNGKPS